MPISGPAEPQAGQGAAVRAERPGRPGAESPGDPDPSAPLWLGFKQWLPVICLALVGFIFVTTELMPIGLLRDISRDFNLPETLTGLMVTVYAWLVALCSLPLTMLTARLNRKTLLLAVLAGFVLSQFLASLAQGFNFLLSARLMTALCHALFWSVAPPLAVRVAPSGGATRALAVMAVISSLATILGMPIGTLIGHRLGWRSTFALIGLLSLLIGGLLALYLPSSPGAPKGKKAEPFNPFKNKPLFHIYVLTALTVTGHFTAFTYISPFLAERGGFEPSTIAVYLLWLGASGIIGNVLVSRFIDRSPELCLAASLSLLAASLILAGPAASSAAGTALLCLCWGASMGASSLNFQTTVIRRASSQQDVANSLYSSIFNVGIGGGALLGSFLARSFGISGVTSGSALMVLAALAVALRGLRKKTGENREP